MGAELSRSEPVRRVLSVRSDGVSSASLRFEEWVVVAVCLPEGKAHLHISVVVGVRSGVEPDAH